MKKIFLMFLLLSLSLTVLFGFKVTMVTDAGGLGDQSFNDGTWAGVKRAGEEFGIDTVVIQSNEQSDYTMNLSKAAENSEVVIAVGFLLEDAMKTVAPQYPDTHFIGIDMGEADIPNVRTYSFKEQEGGFLVGFLAASMTKTAMISAVGGMPIPPVKRYEIGFRAGAKAYNQLHGTNVNVIAGYTQSFTDIQKGKTMTEAQISQGSDIILQIAGLCGLGVFNAVKEKGEGYYGLGADCDQDYIAPGRILASALKRIDNAAYFGIADSYEGYFDSGLKVLGLVEDGIGISEMKYTRDLVPEFVLLELIGLQTAVKNGDLVIPETEESLEAFKINF